MTRGVFIDQYTDLGGGQRILLDLLMGFSSRGHQPLALFPGTGYVPAILQQSGISTDHFFLPQLGAGRKSKADLLRFFASVPRSARSIVRKAKGTDFLYVNAPRAMLAGVLAAKRLGVPMVAAVHLIHHGAERRLLEWCFRKPNVRLVTFCSRFAEQSFSGLGSKAMVVPNWISEPFLSEPSARDKGRSTLGLEASDVAIGVLGRISRTKGQRLFLEAAMPLLDQPHLKVLVAGSADFEDPAECDELKELAKPYGSRVRFIEAMPAVEFLDCLDVSVMPSLRPEAFGLVAVESMARGVPIVATKLGGTTDTVTEAVGYLVKPDADDMRNALRLLIDNPARRKQMGESGRLRAASHYNPARLVPNAIDTILKAVEQ